MVSKGDCLWKPQRSSTPATGNPGPATAGPAPVAVAPAPSVAARRVGRPHLAAKRWRRRPERLGLGNLVRRRSEHDRDGAHKTPSGQQPAPPLDNEFDAIMPDDTTGTVPIRVRSGTPNCVSAPAAASSTITLQLGCNWGAEAPAEELARLNLGKVAPAAWLTSYKPIASNELLGTTNPSTRPGCRAAVAPEWSTPTAECTVSTTCSSAAAWSSRPTDKQTRRSPS